MGKTISSRFEILLDHPDRCGEGPIWDARRSRLLWVDIERSLVRQFIPWTGKTSVALRGHPVSGLALDRSGGLVLGGARGIHLLREGRAACFTASPRPIAGPEAAAGQANPEPLPVNDLLADPRGAIYAGTIHWGPEGMERTGGLYLIEREGFPRLLDEGIELANGLALSPDGATLYLTDSAARRIYAYDREPRTSGLSRRRVLVQVPSEEGIPDGLTTDEEGFLWSAQWYGGQVVRYDPEGEVERRIRLPARQVSSLSFGGEDLDELYITTAREPWRSRLAPAGHDFEAPCQGGALYRVRPGIRGRLEHLADLGKKSEVGSRKSEVGSRRSEVTVERRG